MINLFGKKQSKRKPSEGGFTLAEILIAAVILAITFTGLLLTYLRCMELNEISRNTSLALQDVRSKMEEIRNTQYDLIVATHDNTTFTNVSINGRGVVDVNNANPNLLQVTVDFSWRNSNGRVFGEDTNLNGVINAGEDQNGNGILDSPVQLTTLIFNPNI